jgi:hypothetical protein
MAASLLLPACALTRRGHQRGTLSAPKLSEAEELTFYDPSAGAAAPAPPRRAASPSAAALLRELASAWATTTSGAAAEASSSSPSSRVATALPKRISDTWQLNSAIDRIWEGDTQGVAEAVANPGEQRSEDLPAAAPELGDVLSDVEASEVPDLKQVLDGESNGMGQPHAAWHEDELMAGDDPSLSVSRLPETGGGDAVWQNPLGAGSTVQLPIGQAMNAVETVATPVG